MLEYESLIGYFSSEYGKPVEDYFATDTDRVTEFSADAGTLTMMYDESYITVDLVSKDIQPRY